MYVFKSLQRKLTSDKFDATMGRMACWAVSGFIMVTGLLKVSAMHLTEPQLFFGILLVLAVSLLGIILGVLLPVAQTVEQWRKENNR